MKSRFLHLAVIFALYSVSLLAQPGTYYDSINPSASTFVDDLKARIRSPYTKVTYDNYDETNVANFASRDTTGGQRVVTCVYSGQNYVYTPPFAWGVFSREHTWCHSWMPSYPSESGDEYSDQHHLFPTNQNNANGVRSNHPLGIVTNITSQYLEAKYGTNSLGQNVYEPRAMHKGDAARALLYMSVRYDGVDSKNWTFDYLNSTTLPGLSEAPQDVATLLQWHKQDPPDKWEVDRNNYVQSIQQNRNPFVDHPEYVNYINVGDLSKLSPTYAAEPSSHLSGISASVSGSTVTIKWTDATGAQLPSGYFLMAYNWDQFFIPIDGETYGEDTNLADGSAFVNISYTDPDSIQFTGLTVGKTYYFTVYSFNGDGSERNYKIDGTVPAVNAQVGTAQTEVQFQSSSATIQENAGTYDLVVSVSNPSATTATSVQVVLISGDTASVDNYTTQTVNFPAGSSTPISVSLTIVNDTAQTGDRVLLFELQNVSGGNSAVVGSPNQFTLTIEDVATGGGDVIINEFSQGASGAKEWVEILVVTDGMSLKNYRLKDNSATVGLDIELTGSGFSNLSRGSLIVLYNGGDVDNLITPDLTYDGSSDKTLVLSSLNNSGDYALNRVTGWSSTTGAFGNSTASDVPRLFDPLGNLVHQVPSSAGSSTATAFMGNSVAKAQDAANWTAVSASAATPAQPNGGDNTTWILTALPVELEDFNVTATPEGAVLTWMTASETDNYGFEIQRSFDSRSWTTIAFVPGAGTTNSPRRYSYVDADKMFGFVFYRLKQVDLDSAFSFSRVYQAFRGSVTEGAYFPPNYPNPFNPSTDIRFAFSERMFATLKVYDIRGAEVATLFNGYVEPNRVYEERFDAVGLPSGIYYSRLIGGGEVRVQKMMLMK